MHNGVGPMARPQGASPRAATGLNVAIVGGSLAGCAAAIALRRAGCAVTVYERSRGKLEDRGAGIGMPLALLHTLIERDFVDASMAHFQATKAAFVLRADAEDGRHVRGQLLWEQPIAAAVTNWGIVYRHLRGRIPDAIYHQGQGSPPYQSMGTILCQCTSLMVTALSLTLWYAPMASSLWDGASSFPPSRCTWDISSGGG